MKLSVHMDSEFTVKRMRNFLSSCAKIGADERKYAGSILLIEATPERMLWRVINSGKSACLLLTLGSKFFDHYVLYQVNVLTTSVLLKHVMAAFRTQKIRHLELEIHDAELVTIRLDRLHKKYKISCVDEEHLAANVNREEYPTCITADAFQLHKVLASFQSTLDEISLVARPDHQEADKAQAIQMVSYVSATKEKQLQKKGATALRTHIQMDTKGTELFKSYTNSCDATIDVTFNLKDLSVIVQFCKAVGADVKLLMGEAGTPLLAEAAWDDRESNDTSEHVQAELLLATISDSIQDSLPEPQATAAGHGAAPQRAPTAVPTPGTALPQQQRQRTPAPAPARAPAAALTPAADTPGTLAPRLEAQATLRTPALPGQNHPAPARQTTAAPIGGAEPASAAADPIFAQQPPGTIAAPHRIGAPAAGDTPPPLPMPAIPEDGPPNSGGRPSLRHAVQAQSMSAAMDASAVEPDSLDGHGLASHPSHCHAASDHETTAQAAPVSADQNCPPTLQHGMVPPAAGRATSASAAQGKGASMQPPTQAPRPHAATQAARSAFSTQLMNLANELERKERSRQAASGSGSGGAGLGSWGAPSAGATAGGQLDPAHASAGFEKVGMRPAEADTGYWVAEGDNEFGADDEECLATPVEERPALEFP